MGLQSVSQIKQCLLAAILSLVIKGLAQRLLLPLFMSNSAELVSVYSLGLHLALCILLLQPISMLC